MSIVIDLIIIGILILTVFYGYKKGLVNVAVKLCTTIIAIIATVILYMPVSNLIINATAIDEQIENTIYKNVSNVIENKNEENEEKNALQELKSNVIENAKNNVLQPNARIIAINVVNISVMILLFLSLKLGLTFVKALSDAITKLPIIKQFNKAGGVLYGILIGFIIIFISLEILKFIVEINPNSGINNVIEKSIIGSILYDNNLIDILLK